MSVLSEPFPLDGGRVGMGVITASARALTTAPFAPLAPLAPLAPAPKSPALTPIPAPSPIEGEGRGALQ